VSKRTKKYAELRGAARRSMLTLPAVVSNARLFHGAGAPGTKFWEMIGVVWSTSSASNKEEDKRIVRAFGKGNFAVLPRAIEMSRSRRSTHDEKGKERYKFLHTRIAQHATLTDKVR
jgi:hypothetical protein